jgi:hemoglobin
MAILWPRLLLLAGLTFGTPAHAATLYDDLGAHDGVVQLVDAVTVLWLADPKVGPTFADTNIPRFKRLLVDQLCQLSGGDCAYRGQTMQAAHKGLGLHVVQFNALVEDLQAAMRGRGIPFATQNRLLALLAPMERDVVTK